jgi:tetrahydromethanopterin S-methyltransferase subunit G
MKTIDFIAFIWGVHAATKPQHSKPVTDEYISPKIIEKYKVKLTDTEVKQAFDHIDKQINDGIGLVFGIVVGFSLLFILLVVLSSMCK